MVKYATDKPNRDVALRIIKGYSEMVQNKVDQGWDAYLLSIMFHELRGPRNAVISAMNWEVHVAYARSLTRIVRNPKSPSQAENLPIWFVCPDYPVAKRAKKQLRDVALNDGLHVGGIALIPPVSRLGCRLDGHFLNHQRVYTGNGSHIRKIAAELIRETPEKATDYVFKALKRGRVSLDDISVFPLSRNELTSQKVA